MPLRSPLDPGPADQGGKGAAGGNLVIAE
jgi:hypothetical protein